jgi:hypothetical protein
MPYSHMTSTTFDEQTFIAAILSRCRSDHSLNPTDLYTEKYITEIGFNTETERLILEKLRKNESADSPIWDQSLHLYLLIKLDYALDDLYDSDADTDCED